MKQHQASYQQAKLTGAAQLFGTFQGATNLTMAHFSAAILPV